MDREGKQKTMPGKTGASFLGNRCRYFLGLEAVAVFSAFRLDFSASLTRFGRAVGLRSSVFLESFSNRSTRPVESMRFFLPV